MADNQLTEEHLRNCMLFNFRSAVNAMVTTKEIYDVYGDILKIYTCKCWFRKFSNSIFNFTDSNQRGCTVEFDKDALKTLVETNSKLSIQKIAFQATGPTVQKRSSRNWDGLQK